MEITSYGGLIDGMTKDELTSGTSRPRNREIMRIYKDMELVEQLGSGMNRMNFHFGNS
nr:ATP-binding protein [Fibrobacter sp.]